MKSRICIVQKHNSIRWGTKSFIELCMMLGDQFDVVACIPKGKTNLRKELVLHKINFYEVVNLIPNISHYSGSSSFFSPKSIKNNASFFYSKQFCEEISELNPTIVFFNSIVTSVSAQFFSSDIKKVCIVRETITNRFFSLLFKKNFEKNFDLVLFISKEELLKMNLKKVKNEVFTDSYKLNKDYKKKKEARKELKINNEKFLLLFLGGMDYIKGLDVILNSLKYLPEEVQILIGGYLDKDSFRQISRSIKNPRVFIYRLKLKYLLAKYENRINIIGFQSNIERAISACDILIFPSKKVHQPKPAIEAGYFKKPVIISRYKETSLSFTNEINCLTFKPNNPKDLSKKILTLMNDHELSGFLVNQNYMKSVTKHNFTDNTEKIIKLMKEVIK